jgi:hypothetical protein
MVNKRSEREREKERERERERERREVLKCEPLYRPPGNLVKMKTMQRCSMEPESLKCS